MKNLTDKTTMKQYPIFYNTDMVEAILKGRKTQTRRPVKPQPIFLDENGWPWRMGKAGPEPYDCNFGESGDLLWVRETFMPVSYVEGSARKIITRFKAGSQTPVHKNKWKASMHMPKTVARIWLEIVNIKTERLQEISEADAVGEGIVYNSTLNIYKCPVCNGKGHSGSGIDFLCEDGFYTSAKKAFQALWVSVYGIESWYEDPRVWAIKFDVVSTTGKGNIEEIARLDGVANYTKKQIAFLKENYAIINQ